MCEGLAEELIIALSKIKSLKVISRTSSFRFKDTEEDVLSIAKYHADLGAVVVQFVNTSGGNTWMKTEKVYKRIVRILEKNEG